MMKDVFRSHWDYHQHCLREVGTIAYVTGPGTRWTQNEGESLCVVSYNARTPTPFDATHIFILFSSPSLLLFSCLILILILIVKSNFDVDHLPHHSILILRIKVVPVTPFIFTITPILIIDLGRCLRRFYLIDL